MILYPWQFLLIALSDWVNREQLAIIEYLVVENRVLREQLGKKRLRFTDDQRRNLAAKAAAIGRKALEKVGCVVSPDTQLRWYRLLIARKYDGSAKRGPGRPPTSGDIRALIIQMARENASWGYTRIQGALKNLSHDVARTTVQRIMLENGLDPARRNPQRARLRSNFDRSCKSLCREGKYLRQVYPSPASNRQTRLLVLT